MIMHNVSDIATDPGLKWVYSRTYNGLDRYVIEGVRDGINVRIVIEPAGEGIISAFPIK